MPNELINTLFFRHLLMHQSIMVIIPILSTCTVGFKDHLKYRSHSFFYTVIPHTAAWHQSPVFHSKFIKPQPSVGDWVFMHWNKWKTFSALVGTYIYCMFRSLDWFHCFSLPLLLFILAHASWQTGSEICLWAIIEVRASQKDMSENIWSLEASGLQLVGNPWQCDFLI